jgi:prepilin-type N-terminal cleavage/methylation domain-containing protein
MGSADFNILHCNGSPSLSVKAGTRFDGSATSKSAGSSRVLKGEGKPSHSKARRGMTLIELLIVVSIILIAAAVFVPRLQPMMDHSKVREAARVIQLYMSTARNQAMATGRSCGVMIEPLPSDTGCAMNLSQVETPPPYGGATEGAYATVTSVGVNGNYANCKIALYNQAGQPEGMYVNLHQGDLIQVGYQGFWMLLASAAPVGSTTLNASLDISHGELPAWINQPISGPYKIIRWPTKSVAPALQLPAVTCIDLTASGFDPVGTGSNSSQPTWPIQTPLPTAPTLPTPVIITFSADGKVDWVSNWKYPAGQPAIAPLYLLIGMRKKVYDLPTDPNIANANINDFNSLWLSVDAATGLILISDPAATPTDPKSVQNIDYWNSRANARQASANGGGK